MMVFKMISIGSMLMLLSACSCKNISLHDECRRQLNCDTYTIGWGPEILYLEHKEREKRDVENYMSSIGFNKSMFFISEKNESIELFYSDGSNSKNYIVLCYFRIKNNKWELYNYNYFGAFNNSIKTERSPRPVETDYGFKKYILAENKI